jgi:hypothetical protein
MDYVQLDPWTIYNGRMICNGLLHASERKNKTGIGQISFSRKYGNEGQTNIDRRK